MGNFTRVGPDLSGILADEDGGKAGLTSDEVDAGLAHPEDAGDGSRVMSIQLNPDGTVSGASNTGIDRVNVEQKRSNYADSKIAHMDREYQELGERLERGYMNGSIEKGSLEEKRILDRAAELQSAAEELVAKDIHSSKVEALEEADRQDETTRRLLADGERTKEQLREIEKRRQQRLKRPGVFS